MPCTLFAQKTSPGVTSADLKTRLYAISDDSMGGRATGSKGDFQTAEYIAAEFKRFGLKPGGENGTYFQTVPFFRLQAPPNSRIQVNGGTLELGRDFIVNLSRSAPRPVEGKRVVYGGVATDSSTWISADSARGRIVLFSAGSLQQSGAINASRRFLEAATVVFPVRNALAPELAAAIAAGRVMTDTSWTGNLPGRLYVTPAAAELLLGRPLSAAKPGDLGEVVHGNATLAFLPLLYPARNVIGILQGGDSKRAGTYVNISAHNDHVGFDHSPGDHDSLHILLKNTRPLGADSPVREPTQDEWMVIRHSIDSVRKIRPPRQDSIRNGADDDGSGTAVLLEIAQQLASGKRLARSVQFVSHVAEEEGLLGSRWHTDHTIVPRDSIISEFDMDQLARGNKWDLDEGSPTYLEIIGMRRLSKEYGDIIEAVNARQPRPFTFNLTYDQPGHPLRYYCRADHYSYARYDIPSVAISRGEHADYHQVTDEAQYADYEAMERIGRFVADVASALANLDHRPFVDFARHDANAACVQ